MKGVIVQKLNVFSDDNGKVMHMMKCTDPIFTKFGEIYFSVINPGKIKGWHKNNKSIKNYVVIKGNIRLVLYDGKEVEEITIGEDNYCLVQIPTNVWSSFKAINDDTAIIADLMELPFNPKDAEKTGLLSLTDYWKKNT